MNVRNEEAPEVTASAGSNNRQVTCLTNPVYPNIEGMETEPSTFPRQTLRRGRRGGWTLTVFDGWGKRISKTLPTRGEAIELLDVFSSLRSSAADSVIGGVV